MIAMAGQARRLASMLGLAQDTALDDEYYDEGVGEMADVTPISRGAAVRMGPAVASDPMHRISTVRPRIFRDARMVGEPYRAGVPVIMNLTDASDSDSQRLVDFASGMVLALHGKLERITPRVFLLSPSSIEVRQEGAESRRQYDGD
jgi:cell division inhibitor SepF